MKKLLGSLIVLAALALPALAQVQRMTGDDQDKFDNYYSRWVQDKQNGDRDDMVSMEHHMQDLMNRYSIPADTPYDQVAAQNNMAPPPAYENRAYDNRGYYGRGNYRGGWDGRRDDRSWGDRDRDNRSWGDRDCDRRGWHREHQRTRGGDDRHGRGRDGDGDDD